MSEKNTIDMEERLQVILLRAYAQKDLDVKKFPYVAMEADGSWWAYPIEPRFGKEKVWEGMFCVALHVNGGVVDPEESLFCWTEPAPSVTPDPCPVTPESATRTVWMAVKEGEALRLDVSLVAEPLPAPQEVATMRAPTMEELDAFLGVSWADNCPLDV
jgi:hypothetical protein